MCIRLHRLNSVPFASCFASDDPQLLQIPDERNLAAATRPALRTLMMHGIPLEKNQLVQRAVRVMRQAPLHVLPSCG